MKDLVVSDVVALAMKAGEVVMELYGDRDLGVEIKADDSPVTVADKASNDLLMAGLQELYPEIPIISEEVVPTPFEIRKKWDYCWMIDPLDGTKEFIKGNGEFSINIALIHEQRPVFGLIHFPVQGWTYWAEEGKGAWKVNCRLESSDWRLQNGECRMENGETIVVMISRSHAGQREEEFIQKIKDMGYEVSTKPHGSAMKHCLLAEGLGDVYPKFGLCSEWDTAPGQLILHEAGGLLTATETGEPLVYNKENFLNPEFIMWGSSLPISLQRSLLDNYSG